MSLTEFEIFHENIQNHTFALIDRIDTLMRTVLEESQMKVNSWIQTPISN